MSAMALKGHAGGLLPVFYAVDAAEGHQRRAAHLFERKRVPELDPAGAIRVLAQAQCDHGCLREASEYEAPRRPCNSPSTISFFYSQTGYNQNRPCKS